MTDALRGKPAAALANEPSRAPLGFHRSLPGYAPTPLREDAELAGELRVRQVWLKDESERLGLPSFKVLGASWAIRVALANRLGYEPERDTSLEELGALVNAADGFGLVAATDGNHGRAVARVARVLRLPARIFVPTDMVAARRQAIIDEGAELVVVDGGYDEAVQNSAAAASRTGDLVISDTSWPGYDTIPRAVIDGYSTILWEIDDRLRAQGLPDPDAVFVPVGVGALAAAVIRHFRRPKLTRHPSLISIEPRNASCLLASVRAGQRISLTDPQDSIMAGLNCGTPSPVAWPELAAGFDLYLEIDDDSARDGMRLLAQSGIAAGECSGGTLGGARDVLRSPLREELHLPPDPSVLLILTEGVTDPVAYRQIVTSPPT